jgi:hypothetical protein
MAQLNKNMNKNQGHHVVPKSYLNQWRGFDNQLQLFTHDDGRFFKRGSDWTGFKRKNYNIYQDENNFYLPEQITEKVDAQAIEVIRSISFNQPLTGYERSVIATAVALQYMRTPRFRAESDLMLEAQFKEPFLEHQRKRTDEDLIKLKQEIVSEKPETSRDSLAIEEIIKMTDQEFIDSYRDFIMGDNSRLGLNTFGHSKFIFKVPEKAEGIFRFLWLVYKAPKDSSFITSDNPCFAVPKEESDFGVGLFSPNGLIIFPLRPDLCLIICPGTKACDEVYKKLSKSLTKEINQLIVKHSYDVVVGGNTTHLESLLKNYSHKKTKEVSVKDSGDYKLIALK